MAEVLFLCTGNLCRSPTAEWFFDQQLLRYGPDDVTVTSAGGVRESARHASGRAGQGGNGVRPRPQPSHPTAD